jgi:hypothetical protein
MGPASGWYAAYIIGNCPTNKETNNSKQQKHTRQLCTVIGSKMTRQKEERGYRLI